MKKRNRAGDRIECREMRETSAEWDDSGESWTLRIFSRGARSLIEKRRDFPEINFDCWLFCFNTRTCTQRKIFHCQDKQLLGLVLFFYIMVALSRKYSLDIIVSKCLSQAWGNYRVLDERIYSLFLSLFVVCKDITKVFNEENASTTLCSEQDEF